MSSQTPRQVDSSIVENRKSPLTSPLTSNGSSIHGAMDTDSTLHEGLSSHHESVPTLVTYTNPTEARGEEAVTSKEPLSDNEDSPDLVIVTHPDDAVSMSNDNGKEMSGEEIDLSVPLEESSDEEPEPGTHLKYMPTQTNGSTGRQSQGQSLSPEHKSKQVGKLKRFFMTLQGFGNNLGSEVAEQVQELITALVNKTATIEEFHQEIQTVTNHPLKEFIIPFLQENLDYLRDELKESSKTLSDMLGQADTDSTGFALTPQPADDELVVYKTPQSAKTPVGVINSRKIITPVSTIATTTDYKSTPKATRSVSQVVSGGVLIMPSSHQNVRVYGPNAGARAGSVVQVLSPNVTGTRMTPSIAEESALLRQPGRKRDRSELNPLNLSVEKDTQTLMSNKYHPHMMKRARQDIPYSTDDVVLTTGAPRSNHHPPPYPQPPLTYPIQPNTPTSEPPRHPGTLVEDWKHLEMMLSSMHGMMERTRQAVALLKDRVSLTQADIDRRELDQEAVVVARVTEAVEKVKQRAEDERQALLLETRKQIRDAVSSVRGEMEARVSTASQSAVQDALKEAHKQSNSKENCWNCGRRATETCSGCNKARYCGTFCQHKDWTNHMHHCASGVQQPGPAKQPATTVVDYDRRREGIISRGEPLTRGLVSVVPGTHMRTHGHADMASVAVKTEKT